VGDNADAFDDDATQTTDSDNDGYGDSPQGTNADAFPNDSTQWADADNDGYGDNPDGANADQFPEDAFEWIDSDSDGVGDNADAFPNDDSETLDSDGDGMGDNEQAVLEAKQAEEEAEAAAAQQTMLIGGGILMLVITAAVVLFLRKRIAEEGVEDSKDFTMPDLGAQPAAADPMATQQGYQPAAVNAFEPVVAQPVSVAPINDNALNALMEPEPATTGVALPEPIATSAEPTVVNQWTDESGHTWRVMSDGSNRWWNGTDWQKV
jgi:hypothetical protein